MRRPEVLFFDSNESMLDLSGMKLQVTKAFDGREDLVSLWFSTMLQHSLVDTVTSNYHDFGTIGAACMQMVADAVLPSLDAGTAKLYHQINRPLPEITFERLLEGLTDFQNEYTGKLWIEVMLIRDLNDTGEALRAIAETLHKIGPDEVHINPPTRPPVETWVKPPNDDGLMRASAILGDIAQVVHPAEGTFDLSGYDNVLDAIIGIITRHPMQQEQIERTLTQWAPKQVEQSLVDLENSGRAQVVERYGIRFWSAGPSYYPIESQSQATSPDRLWIRKPNEKK